MRWPACTVCRTLVCRRSNSVRISVVEIDTPQERRSSLAGWDPLDAARHASNANRLVHRPAHHRRRRPRTIDVRAIDRSRHSGERRPLPAYKPAPFPRVRVHSPASPDVPLPRVLLILNVELVGHLVNVPDVFRVTLGLGLRGQVSQLCSGAVGGAPKRPTTTGRVLVAGGRDARRAPQRARAAHAPSGSTGTSST